MVRHHPRAFTPGDALEQSELARPAHGLVARVDVELAVDAPRVGLDGVERHVQRVADLALRELAGEQAQHAQLPVRQLVGGPVPAARRRGAAAVRCGRATRPECRAGGSRSITRRASRSRRRPPSGSPPCWRPRPARGARRRSRPPRRRAARARRPGRSAVARLGDRPRCSSARPWTTRASVVAQCSARPASWRAPARAAAARGRVEVAALGKDRREPARGVDHGEVVTRRLRRVRRSRAPRRPRPSGRSRRARCRAPGSRPAARASGRARPSAGRPHGRSTSPAM